MSRLFARLDPAYWAPRKRALRAWLCASIIGVLVALVGVPDTALRTLKARLRQHPASGRVVVVTVDDKTLNALGQWPLKRRYYAQAIEKALESGAHSVYLNLIFQFPQGDADDDAVEHVITRFPGQVFLASYVTSDDQNGRLSLQLPMRRLQRNHNVVSTNLPINDNGEIWKFPYAVSIVGERLPSLAAHAAGRVGGINDFFHAEDGIDIKSIPSISLADLIAGKVSYKLKDCIVIIGVASDSISDHFILAPFGRIPNSFAQAVAVETLLKSRPREFGLWTPLVFTIIVLFTLSMTSNWKRRIVLSCLLLFSVLFVELITSGNIWISVMPSLAAFAAFILAEMGSSLRELIRSRSLINRVSGLRNLAALRDLQIQPGRQLVVAQIHNFAEVIAGLPDGGEPALIGQIVARIELGIADGSLYQGDSGVFAWLETDVLEVLGERLDALYAMFRSPVTVDGRAIDLSVTFGVDAGDSRTIANRLGSALVAATEAAADGGKWRAFDKAKLADAAWKLSLLSQLDAAIDDGALWVAYQPKLDLGTRRIIGAEALVRWTHPEKGAISPIEFVAAAEQHNRIEKLTMHVLDRAVLAAATINAHGIAFGIAVNLSTRLLETRSIVDAVASALAAHRLDPGLLTLEITETATINSEAGITVLDELRDLGVRISIDDYGTGLSTLDYLKRIPASEIKIDRSFIQSILANSSDLLMVNSTIQLAHSLGHVVVAEGVENDDVLARLVDLRCDIAQGYRIGRPMTFQDLARRLLAERQRAA